MEQVNCIICGNERSRTLFDSRSFIYPNKEFRLVKCSGCGLVFMNPRPAPEEIGQYYKNYHLHVDISKLNRITKSILLAETVGNKRYAEATQNNKFLEIGFGDGLFMEYMKNRKWDVSGMEIEEGCVNRLKRMGMENVFTGDIFSGNFKDNSFDLIRMNHVLEHTHEPLKVLLEAKRILKKGGRLILSVPNFQGACHRLFREHAYPLHLPFHLYFFTSSSLEKLVSQAGGLKIIRVYKNNMFIPYLASLIQFLKSGKNSGIVVYGFSPAKLIIHRLVGLIAMPFMRIMDLFVEGDNLEIEIITT